MNQDIQNNEDLKPNGSEFLYGIGAVIFFLFGIIQLSIELYLQGDFLYLGTGFLLFSFECQLKSNDNLGFQKKYGLRNSLLKIGVIISFLSMALHYSIEKLL